MNVLTDSKVGRWWVASVVTLPLTKRGKNCSFPLSLGLRRSQNGQAHHGLAR